MHAFLIGGKIEKIKLYVPQTAEFYKQRMGGERMRAAKPTNRETFTRFIYARKIKRYRTGNVRYRLKQNVTNARYPDTGLILFSYFNVMMIA